MRSGSSVAYLDSSALVKLAAEEPESAALREGLAAWPRRVSSRLSVVEVLRAAHRRGDGAMEPARQALAGVALISVDRRVVDAVEIDPLVLRTLDAIHIATALTVGPRLDAFVTYDGRQEDAAAALGLPVASPR